MQQDQKSTIFGEVAGPRVGTPRSVTVRYNRLRFWLRPCNDNHPAWRRVLGRFSPYLTGLVTLSVIALLLI